VWFRRSVSFLIWNGDAHTNAAGTAEELVKALHGLVRSGDAVVLQAGDDLIYRSYCGLLVGRSHLGHAHGCTELLGILLGRKCESSRGIGWAPGLAP